MYVVTVKFAIEEMHRERFMPAMLENARASLNLEPGCRQFDVCQSSKDACIVFLYELYDNEEAFQAHLATQHFKTFDALTSPWIHSREIDTYVWASNP